MVDNSECRHYKMVQRILVLFVLVSLGVWLYQLVLMFIAIVFAPTIPSGNIDEASEWQGSFDMESSPLWPLPDCMAKKYEQRTGKATTLFFQINFTEIRSIPNKDYNGEYPPARWFVFAQSKILPRPIPIIICIALNILIVVCLRRMLKCIRNKLEQKSVAGAEIITR
ncbi:MAG TPA: hypothetical protein PLA90_15310 [Candidatus Sumerlaeota bacterium]|nr:hypothetical protein [Candidatus Sumerlaeota bacterium]